MSDPVASLTQARRDRIRDKLMVKPGRKANLAGRDSAWKGGRQFASLAAGELKAAAKRVLAMGVDELAEAQELLWASDTYSLLVVFQGMDAAGKDSTIKHVLSGVNPQGVHVTSFKQPSSEELDHDFLWRIAKAVPERGRIGVFNRSHYEDVGVVRVHPELVERLRLPPGTTGPNFWKTRYDSINDFERHLYRNGTHIIKFFLHVSKAEQKRRFLRRLDDPERHWKFNAGDVTERTFWDDYMQAYEDALTATSTPWAPWYVIPADHKPVMQAMVAALMARTIRDMELRWPELPDEERARQRAARKQLEAE
jgi:PPK2 family polyphosphate:nucleotide phosphotransferase